MKKFLITCCFMAVSLLSYAGGGGLPINLTVGVVNPTIHHGPRPRTPIQPPVVYLDDYTLSFNAFEEDCAIQLLDEDDESSI